MVPVPNICVTRHPALVEYLREIGLLCETDPCPIIAHASPDDVRGKVVCGVLPLHLAAEAEMVVEIPLEIPAELRGQELSLEQVRSFAKPARTYRVELI